MDSLSGLEIREEWLSSLKEKLDVLPVLNCHKSPVKPPIQLW